MPLLNAPTAEAETLDLAVIGGGPAGLMAAEAATAVASRGRSLRVEVFDAMPSVGRKFLLAGRGGLNLTHAEPLDLFVTRYGAQREIVGNWLTAFGPAQLRAWAQGLGIDTFIGSSGRVFPREMKAAPLLRAWLSRLRAAGVVFHPRHRWCGWDESGSTGHVLRFTTPGGDVTRHARAVVLALGGGSWSRLGSDGAWLPLLARQGIALQPLRPANCGFDVTWSDYWRQQLAPRFSGQPVKAVAARVRLPEGGSIQRRGEFVVTANGVEGGLIYAVSAPLRDCIETTGSATLHLDLAPERTLEQLRMALAQSRGRDSWSTHLRRRIGFTGVKTALLREMTTPAQRDTAGELATAIKALPLRLLAPRPLEEAISSAGGVDFAALTPDLMLKKLPGVFCAGEMLDWEAPTGGYLLTGCFASGRMAGAGALRWVQRQHETQT